MKIVLLIAVCKQYPRRIQNQVANLQAAVIPSDVQLTPLFVFGKDDVESNITIPIGQTVTVDSPERYNLLYRKLFAAFKFIDQNLDYDFVWKIDDDTKINLDRFTPSLIKTCDYIGRMFSGKDGLSVTLNFGFHDSKTIELAPSFSKDVPHEFATGDSYFLSKKAVQCLLSAEDDIRQCQGVHICEDRLFGSLLHDKGLVVKDIKVLNETIVEHCLQVTENLLSLHPIHESVYPQLIGKSPEEQLTILYDSCILNLTRRKVYLADLETKIKNVVVEFLNSNKSIGMG